MAETERKMAELCDQVTFDGVAKSYPVDAHVECRYKMKTTHRPTTYDWIGVFKVGWLNTKEFHFYHWVPYPKNKGEGEEYHGSLLFQSVNLPKEDGEYYQFVYFNDKGKMCGASSPFHFVSPQNDDFIEEVMQDDEDMLYITTKRGQLNEKKKECEKLALTCEALNQEITNLSEQLKLANDRLREVETEKEELVQKLQGQGPLEERLGESEKALAHRDEIIQELKAEVADLNSKIGSLNLEQSLLLEQIKTTEANAAEEVELLKKKLEEAVPDQEALDTLQAQLSSSQDAVAQLEKYKEQHKEIIKDQHDKLQASEERHNVDKTEIATLNETLINLSTKVEEVNTANENLKTKIAKIACQYDAEKKDWANTLQEMEKEKNSLLSRIGELNYKLEHVAEETVSAQKYDIQEDRHIALQVAYNLLKTELSEQNKALAAQQRREQRHRVTTDAQIEELKEKLKEGQEEYTKLATQKAKLDKRLAKSSKYGGGASDGTLKRSMSAASKEDLTREELLKMLEQLNNELEARTLKKDKYKDKYLEEKQRAATLREYYKGETDKIKAELNNARALLDAREAAPTAAASTLAAVEPIVYPAVSRSTSSQTVTKNSASKRLSNSGSSDKKNKGALEQSIVEDTSDQPPLTPLPAPLEPTKTSSRQSANTSNHTPMATSNPRHPSQPYPSTIIYPLERQRATEELVVGPTTHSDSDEDNDGADRFHDAVDQPASIPKCFLCEKIFGPDDTEEMRNAHCAEHLDGATVMKASSSEKYYCPICRHEWSKQDITLDEMQAHVDAHFTQT